MVHLLKERCEMSGKGERAFPTCGHSGMSMLDYFAEGAMVLLPNPDCNAMTKKEMAAWCYDQAEAMLAERQRRSKQ